MNYQPDLFVKNIGDATAKSIYKLINGLDFGEIQYVEIEKDNAFVAMKNWDIKRTKSTRLKLHQSKALLLYYSQNSYWKVYSYENRFSEEEQQEKRIRIEKQKEAMRFTPFRIEDAQSNRSNPFISAPEWCIPKGGILNDNWCKKEAELREQTDHDMHEESKSEYLKKTQQTTKMPVLDYGNVDKLFQIVTERRARFLHLFASKMRKVTGPIHSFLPPKGAY